MSEIMFKVYGDKNKVFLEDGTVANNVKVYLHEDIIEYRNVVELFVPESLLKIKKDTWGDVDLYIVKDMV